MKKTFAPAEYLAMEQAAEYKSEYYNGEIFAMAGGTANHNSVAVQLIIELGIRLVAKPCQVFNSDMRLLVQRSGLYTYPDVMVVCGKIQFAEQRKDLITNPILLFKVLSESTRAYDRGAEFNFYKQIPTLQEYVLVESERAHVEVYRRAGGLWTIEMREELDTNVKLTSVECEIPLAQIYAKVSWLE